MAIFNVEDLPELTDLNAINRSVPAMPSGMEKEEESEKHLQVHTMKKLGWSNFQIIIFSSPKRKFPFTINNR